MYVYPSAQKRAKSLLQVACSEGVGVLGKVSDGVLLCDFVAKIEVLGVQVVLTHW